jgi:hypothetical protein
MPTLELYADGWIEVDSDEYVAQVHDEDADDTVPTPIEGLDDPLVERDAVELVLDYPFEHPYRARLTSDNGITLRQIIDAVRSGFREMYRGATHTPIEGLLNEHVAGSYGQAFHGIHDLVIEGILLHEEEGRLEILIGS